MSRHNRRRTRTARNKAPSSSFSTPFSTPSASSYHPLTTPSSYHPPSGPSFSSSLHPHRRPSRTPNDLTALHWHNRYQAWQNRDRRQREERAKLEADKLKLFGGVAGEEDDENNDDLCIRMMEYFSSLDFVVEWAPSASFVSECAPFGVVGREAFE